MSTVAGPISVDIEGVAPTPMRGTLSERDLAELLTSFNDVTSKLQATHETLRAEVARLQGELRDANEALRRSERLAALGEMAAGIAHEIRNPLAGIGLYARMLLVDLDDRPQCRQVAEKIAQGVRGLDAIVGDVLTFARRIEPRCDPCDASALLARALEVCAPQVDLAGAVVERRDTEREPISFSCDHGLMQQAIVNLVRNAAEALAEMPPERRPRRPRIAVDAQRVKVREPGGARTMVSLVIEDNGPGVPEEVRARMFNPFFTTRHTGTGLGLAIVHRIVDAHGGRVRVRDAVGRRTSVGTVVEVLIPDTTNAAGRDTNETERTE